MSIILSSGLWIKMDALHLGQFFVFPAALSLAVSLLLHFEQWIVKVSNIGKHGETVAVV